MSVVLWPTRLQKGDEPTSAKAFGDPWGGEKDGKLYRPDDLTVTRKKTQAPTQRSTP